MSATLLIMAAGLGSRFGGNKQVAQLGPNGELLMEYSVYDALEAGFDKVVFVIRKSMDEMFRSAIGDKIAKHVEVAYAYQEEDTLPSGFAPPIERTKPYGTVHAVLCAKDHINEPFAVINADDYYGKTAFKTIFDSIMALPNEGAASMVCYALKNTVSEHGAVTRGVCAVDAGGMLVKVTETYKIMPCKDGGIRDYHSSEEGIVLDPDAPVSMNFWGFTPWIFDVLASSLAAFVKRLAADDLKTEYPLPVMIDEQMREGNIIVSALNTDSVWFGVTYPEDRALVSDELKALHQVGAYPKQL